MFHWILGIIGAGQPDGAPGLRQAMAAVQHGFRRSTAMNIMNPRDRGRARRVAQWQLRLGWAVAGATLVARLTTVGLQLSRGRLDPVDFGLAIFKSALLIAVVVYYGRYRWPAYLMIGVWPFGFILAWRFAHAPPAVLGVGILIGVALFAGARGAHALHRLRTLDRAPAPAV